MTNITPNSKLLANQTAEKDMMLASIVGLPKEDSVLLEQKYFHKKSLKDLKEELDISESALKLRLLRARNRANKMAKS